VRANFKDLHRLTDDSVAKINLMSYVCWGAMLGEKLVQLTLTAFDFKLTQGHSVFLTIKCTANFVVTVRSS